MKKVFEYQSDCGPVEKIIWDAVAVDFGDFAGVRELAEDDLVRLKFAIDTELLLKSALRLDNE